jgi:hypothetical protein
MGEWMTEKGEATNPIEPKTVHFPPLLPHSALTHALQDNHLMVSPIWELHLCYLSFPIFPRRFGRRSAWEREETSKGKTGRTLQNTHIFPLAPSPNYADLPPPSHALCLAGLFSSFFIHSPMLHLLRPEILITSLKREDGDLRGQEGILVG